MAGSGTPASVDAYLETVPEAARSRVEELRRIVREAAPAAEEVISYAIPAYKQHGWLIYISGYAKHVSISMPPDTFADFPGDLSGYKTSKSTVQFPHDKPLPEDLIRKLIAHRLDLNLKQAAASSRS